MTGIAFDVRTARTDDIAALETLDTLIATEIVRRRLLKSAVAEGRCWIADSVGTILGYGALTEQFFGRDFVALLWVAETARRRGVGSHLLRAMETHCIRPEIFTSTNESNMPMRQLLNARGYEPSGIIYNLDPGDPELIFVKFLSKVIARL